jgi:hypothetical protein
MIRMGVRPVAQVLQMDRNGSFGGVNSCTGAGRMFWAGWAPEDKAISGAPFGKEFHIFGSCFYL